MKKFLGLMLMLSLTISAFAGTDYYWTNNYGAGDHDFTRGSNWQDTLDTVVWAEDDCFYINMGGSALNAIIDSNAIGTNVGVGFAENADGELRIDGGISNFGGALHIGAAHNTSYGKVIMTAGEATFSNYLGVGQQGTGVLDLSGGTLQVDRCYVGGNNADSNGLFLMTGGVFESDTFLTCGWKGIGQIFLDGGQMSMGSICTVGNLYEGLISITDGSFDVASYVRCGDQATGTIDISGGSLSCDSMSIGYNAASTGNFYMSGTTEIDVDEFFGVAAFGTGVFEMSGGVLSADRFNVAINAGATGTALLTGGQMNLVNYMRIGNDGGVATLTIEGDAVKVRTDYVAVSPDSTIEFVLNGSAGVGSGIEIFDGGAELEGLIDVSFVSSTDVGGSYVLMSATEDINDACAPGVLTASSIANGWSSEMVDAGPGQVLMVTSPESVTQQTWNSGTTTINSSISYDVAVVADDTSATIDITTGADADFINLTVAKQAGSTGQVNIDAGVVDVASAAIIGLQGEGGLEMTGGEFYAASVIAASDANSSAIINISGNAKFDVGMLALGGNAELSVSGYQTDIDLETIMVDADSEITFELDGGLAVGSGMMVSTGAFLDGAINIEFLGSRVDGTYTLLRSFGPIEDNTGGDLINTPFCDYEIVEDGIYNALKVTIYSPTSCQEMLDEGLRLNGDINGDCEVDFTDFAQMAENWLLCNNPEDAECNWMISL